MPASGRRLRLLALAVSATLWLTLAGCERRQGGEPSAPPPAAPMQAALGERAMEKRSVSVESTSSEDAAPMQRFVAVRQELRAEVPPEQLADAWSKVRDLCGTLQCELLSSSLLRETPQQPGEGQLEMRVLPTDVDKLLGGLAGVATVVSHVSTAEDKTAEVIDVEARIRNRTEFRDSLRLMLGDTVTKRTMADLLEIQRTLSDTQAELDAMTTQRKVLGQQTSKQHIQIQFVPKRALVRGGDSYNPMTRALREAGAVLAESVATLITFAAVVLPWLVLVVLPLGWLARWALRRRRFRTPPKISA